MSVWALINAVSGALAAAIVAYELAWLANKFTPAERVGMGLVGAGMILTIGPILSVAPTPYEDWSGTLIRIGIAVYSIGRLTRHRYNNWAQRRQARRHFGGRA